MVVDKFIDTFSHHGQLTIPIVPTFGNNDFLPHNIFFPGPNKWLRSYANIWKRFIPEAQRHSFEFGGWFWVDVVPNQLAVFSLNTMYFFDRNAGVDGCAEPSEPGYAHMEWLRIQLEVIRNRGMKAILMGHVPPARTASKQNWDETCWQKYTLWLKQYRDVVVGSVYGHMNIDHFLLQDTKEVDVALGLNQKRKRDPLSLDDKDHDDEILITSKDDYLQELRAEWSDLPGGAIKALVEEDTGPEAIESSKKRKPKKGNKFKKVGGKHAERYQVSLVSPSVVPNYFPTLRVIEYNITGLEDLPVWTESHEMRGVDSSFPESWDPFYFELELKKDLETYKKKKEQQGKKKHDKPRNPHLIIPEKPPAGSTPGPAYFPQPLTLTGYTQYYANLTYLNNDIKDPEFNSNRWRDGDHADDVPKHKKPQPRDFSFEVEYSTFDDGQFRLKDLTVKHYLKLAYRIGQMNSHKKKKKKKKGGKRSLLDFWDADPEEDEGIMMPFDNDDNNDDNNDDGGGDEEFDDDVDEEDEVDEEEVEDEDEDGDDVEEEDFETDAEFEDVVSESKKGKKKKNKKNKGNKKHRTNKAWLAFLNRAFVSTVPDEELKKI